MRKTVITIAALTAAATVWAGWGEVVASFPAPGSQAGGLTYDGQYLWFADYARDTSTIYKMTTAGSYEGQYNVNWGYACGLAWDGTYLWSTALTLRQVYKLNPANCSIIESFTGPSAHMMGMGCDGLYLYINDWQDQRIAKVTFAGSLRQLIPEQPPSPSGVTIAGGDLWYTTRNYWVPEQAQCFQANLSTGSVIASFQCPDSQATDLAFDGIYLWVSGYTTKTIYCVDIEYTKSVAPTSLGKVKALFR